MDDEQKRLLEEVLFSGEKKLSVAKMLYFGGFHGEAVFPFPRPSAEEKTAADELVEKLKKFAVEHIDGDKFDREKHIPDAVYRGLGEIGILAITIPKEYGGLGLSQYVYGRVMFELSQLCSSTALFVNAHQSIGLKALVLFGTKEQKERFLPPLAKGEMLAAFALTERNAGSDASGVETYAEYDPQRKVYILNGRKQWSTNSSKAGFLTVMARTSVQTERGSEDKISAFIVTPDMPGFEVQDAFLDKGGMRASVTANVSFNNMEVPEENILGEKGKGLRVALTVLDYGRTTFGMACTGPATMLWEMTREHAKARYQFNRPLASFGMVKRMLARMAAHVYAMRAVTELTQGLIDRSEEEVLLESAIVKVFVSEQLWQISYDSMQVHGGKSLFTDMPLERIMRDVRLNTIGEGANEVLRIFIGVIGLRDVGLQFEKMTKALKHPISQFGVLKSFGKQGASYFRAPRIQLQTAYLAKEAEQLSRYIRRFALANVRLLVKYREQIVEEQLILDRVAEMVIALYTSIAVISKLDTQLAGVAKPEAKLSEDLASGRLYLQIAFSRFEMALKTLHTNYDEQIEKLSDQLTGIS